MKKFISLIILCLSIIMTGCSADTTESGQEVKKKETEENKTITYKPFDSIEWEVYFGGFETGEETDFLLINHTQNQGMNSANSMQFKFSLAVGKTITFGKGSGEYRIESFDIEKDTLTLTTIKGNLD